MQHTLQDFILQYGYYAIFILLALGIIGLPVPDEILMTFVGYMAATGFFDYSKAVCVSFSGAISGMLISYALGRKLGKPFLWKYGKWVKLTPDRLAIAERWFRKYGLWTVLFGYFVPGIRHLTCYLAGISAVKPWRYILFAGSGALLWAVIFITLGRFIGHNFDEAITAAHHYIGTGLSVLLIAALVVVCLFWRRKKRLQGRSAEHQSK